MPHHEPKESTSGRPAASRRWLSGLLILVVALAVIYVGRGLIVNRLLGRATVACQRGTLADARLWLARAERLSPGLPESGRLLARVHRQLGHRDRWEAVVDSLASSLPANELRLERRLGAIRWGEDRSLGSDELERLVKQGADRDDAAVSLLLGLLAAGDQRRAEQLLRQWESQSQSPAQVAWGNGLYWQRAETPDVAREHFEQALSTEPDHDNARLGLAQTLQQLEELKPAAEHFAAHLRHWPWSEPALLGLSSCSRRLGRVDVAADLMQQAIAANDPSPAVWIEAAEVAYFQGDYAEAIHRFEQTDLEGAQLSGTIRTAATAEGLAGNPARAQELFNRYLAGHSLSFRRQTLESRVREDPSDLQAAEELQQILAGQYVPLVHQAQPPPPISALFSLHCAACHGESGRGDGPANRHLYPPSRNLHSDPYRLVTTVNGFPSRDDIRTVIRGGIPGTSMPAFADLSEAELEQLVEQTYQLRQAGVRSDLSAGFEQLGQELDEQAVDDLISLRGTAGQPLPVPAWPAIGPEQLAIGKKLFAQAACDRCHGSDGSGESSLPLFDDRGNPTVARDLVHDPMKGGEDRAALYVRLRLGMPGTPHPASPTLSDEQVAYLVEYCLSLAQTPKRSSTNYQRAKRANQQVLQSIR